MKRPPPARLHLLPAKAAPYTVVLRRKPTNWFHVLRWNTLTDQIEHGSWYAGTLYPKRADVSFDGNWMVFLAMDPGADTRNRISHPPLLTPVVDLAATGTYHGGGYWENESLLRLNGWDWPFMKGLKDKVEATLPHAIESYEEELGDLGVLYRRLSRDGWIRSGENWGIETRVESKDYVFQCVDDDGWECRPTANHPALRMAYTGFKKGTLQFKFWLEGFPDLIQAETDWACWDCLGQLLLARHGVLYKYGIDDIHAGVAKTRLDLEYLSPPVDLGPKSRLGP